MTMLPPCWCGKSTIEQFFPRDNWLYSRLSGGEVLLYRQLSGGKSYYIAKLIGDILLWGIMRSTTVPLICMNNLLLHISQAVMVWHNVSHRSAFLMITLLLFLYKRFSFKVIVIWHVCITIEDIVLQSKYFDIVDNISFCFSKLMYPIILVFRWSLLF